MKALILAAGQGTRQKNQGATKPLINLFGLSLIERVILTVKRSGIKEFQIVVDCNHEKIRNH